MCNSCGNPEHKVHDFVHLHNHSCYSLLDGLSDPKVLAARSAELGFPAMALTDHGSCAGLYKFQKACAVSKIKPILGIELYITADRHIKEKGIKTNHLLLLAKDTIGLENLYRLSSIAEIEGKYNRKPRVDFDLLTKYSTGLICTTGCCVSEIPDAFVKGEDQRAEQLFCRYKDLFKDDYYVEIMLHKYFKNKEQENKERMLAKKLYELAKKHNVKAIATNDVHYAKKEQAKYHDILLSMQTGDTIKNPERFSFDSDEFYIKSYEEMLAVFGKAPELLLNTMEIMEKVSPNLISPGKDLLPKFDVPGGFNDEADYLKSLVKDGMLKKGLISKQDYRDRIKYEMEAIIKCGYTRYFLILWDMINFARNNGIAISAGRGSAGGSLTLYVLDIVTLDPIKYDLLFERFINPERVSPPDVDLDFDYDRRDEIFDYLTRKYGQNFSSKIGTYNSFAAKGVIRYATKALDLGGDWERTIAAKEINPRAEATKYSLGLADTISSTIEEGPDVNIKDEYSKNNEFKRWMDKYPVLRETALQIEGKLSSAGVHAAGIVVCKDEIVKHVPLREASGVICSQYDKNEVEELGLLKFDCLALKTVTVIHNTVKMIKSRYGVEINIDALTPDDPKVLGLFNGDYNNMDNRGIFQFESAGMMRLLKSVKVDSFNDLIACNAIYRPGPLENNVHELYCDYKHGRKPINPIHPRMTEILKPTYSLIIYQEDFMRIAQELALFTKGQSDTLRKAVGKKDMALMHKQKAIFVEGCVKNGIDSSIATNMFEQIEKFGGYGFNKSHSTSYSYIAYQTAFLKVYYPIEYMCCLLSSVMDKEDKMTIYLQETKRMGIMVRNPHVNLSKAEYAVHDVENNKQNQKYSYLFTPLTAIKGVGVQAVTSIVENQPYSSFRDFLSRVDGSKVNSKVVSCLIDAGCMDDVFGMARPEMKEKYDQIKKEIATKKRKEKKSAAESVSEEEMQTIYDGGIFD